NNDQSNISDLPISLQQILLSNYLYKVMNYSEPEPIVTAEKVTIRQIIVDLFVYINIEDIKDNISEWLAQFQDKSKTTIHTVKQKNNNREIKNPDSQRNSDMG
ncbi:4373_t:CDS:2, partial [Racocetra persica]